MTKNIKVSDELAKRLASHGGFHSTYAQIITMLLDFLRSTTRMTISGHDCTRRRRRRQSDRERNIADFIAKAEEEGQDQVQSQDQVPSDFDVLAEKVKNNDHKEIEIEARREGLTTADFIKRRLHLFAARRTREISRSFEVQYEITKRYVAAGEILAHVSKAIDKEACKLYNMIKIIKAYY